MLLTTLLLPIGIWISDILIKDRNNTFYSLLLLFEFGLIGVFTAFDLFVFYVFWEVALVPMYLMVGGWGGARRGYAAVKFFVYTMAGSVMMLTSIIYLANKAGTFDYAQILAALNSGTVMLNSHEQLLLFLGFFAAFAIKVPVFPAATWLPLTYSEAPATATFLLAAVMSKIPYRGRAYDTGGAVGGSCCGFAVGAAAGAAAAAAHPGRRRPSWRRPAPCRRSTRTYPASCR